jgi:hypothetical protein
MEHWVSEFLAVRGKDHAGLLNDPPVCDFLFSEVYPFLILEDE